MAPVLKLNVFNAHRVDDALQNQAIVINDLDVARKVTQEDGRLSLSHRASSENSERRAPNAA